MKTLEEVYPERGDEAVRELARSVVQQSGLPERRFEDVLGALLVTIEGDQLCVHNSYQGSESFWPWRGTWLDVEKALAGEARSIAGTLREERRQFPGQDWWDESR